MNSREDLPRVVIVRIRKSKIECDYLTKPFGVTITNTIRQDLPCSSPPPGQPGRPRAKELKPSTSNQLWEEFKKVARTDNSSSSSKQASAIVKMADEEERKKKSEFAAEP